ncbi:MAG TPA: hypothetical protein VGM76_08115 [Lacipirellulaceae bacterium]|jgi:hypothetical protein
MNSDNKLLKLERSSGVYEPGERMSGYFLAEGSQGQSIRAAELSVLWYTSGQGEEDFEIHHFERLVDDPGRPLDLRTPRRFAVVLPPSPLSYEGRIVKVCWCVRLRLFPRQGPEMVEEAAFRLGDVPAAPMTVEE